jgi:hypothetical protein
MLAQPGERIVLVGRGHAVAERQAGAPPEIVIGEGGEDADAGRRAVLADVGRLAGDEMIVGDVEAVRPGQPGAAAAQVPLAGDGAQRARLIQVAPERVVKLATVPDFPDGRKPAEAKLSVVSPEFQRNWELSQIFLRFLQNSSLITGEAIA